jgi:dipeptidyl aminopeptidase/acylaminoacyl peptidase
MPGVRRFSAAVLACALLAARPAVGGADAPVPLDYAAYDGWNSIRTPVLSDDGRFLAYALTPEDGDPTLVVRNLDDGSERREARGTAPAFAGGGRFVVFTRLALKRDVDAAKKAKKPADQQPKNGIGILDLQSSAPALVVDSVRSVAVAKDGGTVIAYRSEPASGASAAPSASGAPATPSAAPTATATAAPTLGPGTAPSPGATPSAPATPRPDQSKEPGARLTIRDLARGTTVNAADATAYVLSDDDRFIAYATETKDGKGDGMHVYDVARGTTFTVLSGAGRYRNPALARDGTTLAFLSDVGSYTGPAPRDVLYVVDLHATAPAAVAVAAAGTGLAAAVAPNANGPLRFSRDGQRLFFGTAAAPTPVPSGTPEPMAVDQWSWNDDVLQSQQKHDADVERKRTELAVYDVASAHVAQLGSSTLRTVVTNENPHVALGFDDRAYRRATSWLGEDYADLYAVALGDGARRLLVRGAADGHLSPDGSTVVVWDETARHWIAFSTGGGKGVTLAASAPVRFDLEDDDHPAPPQPNGFGGWLSNGDALLYDRYDVWAANPKTGAAYDLTAGAGRLHHLVYSPVQTDPDAQSFASEEPLLLSIIDERTFASGYARVAPHGGTPQTLFERDENVNGFRQVFAAGLHDLGLPPLAAKHADRYVFTRETLRMFRNLWSSDQNFAHLIQVTDANPQQTKYRWGNARLISFHSRDGTPLRAVLLVPDGLMANRRAPLLTYFYERFSSYVNNYYSPAPGTSPNFIRYVSNGYVVLLPDVHYRIGHPGPSAYDSLMPAVDAALRTGYVDPARIGIAGHSWAAYQINYLITRTHRFRAVEAGAAVDDMISAYGGIRLESGIVRESQYEHTQSRIGATPWDRPDLYLENSGLFGIKNVTTPYLTIHNDQDGAVPQFQGIEYFTAMRRLGKVAYLFSFDGEDHNLRGREQQKYWTVHLDEWFDYWLKGAPRPGWMNGVDYLHRGERDVRPLYGEPQ